MSTTTGLTNIEYITIFFNYLIYKNAASNLLDKDQLLPRVFDKIEKDLYLLGSTAIEDQLQDDVDDVLFNFIKTGIKVWVLTGDKTDTAKSIAFSCKLITHEFILFEFREKTNYKDIYDKITEFLSKVNSGPEKKYALIVSLDEINKIMTKPELIERVKSTNIFIKKFELMFFSFINYQSAAMQCFVVELLLNKKR